MMSASVSSSGRLVNTPFAPSPMPASSFRPTRRRWRCPGRRRCTPTPAPASCRGGAVGDSRRVAGGDHAVLLEDGSQLGQRLHRRLRARVLVGGELDRGFFGLDFDGGDLFFEAAGFVGGGPGFLRAQRVLVALL